MCVVYVRSGVVISPDDVTKRQNWLKMHGCVVSVQATPR